MNKYLVKVKVWACFSAVQAVVSPHSGHAHISRVLRTELYCMSPEASERRNEHIATTILGG